MVEILSDVQKENTSPQPQPQQQQQYQNTIIEENKASTLPSPSKPPRYLSLNNRYRSQRSSDEDAENNIPMADSSSSSPTMEQKFPPK
uniref:Uncharacterized protein n=1 Tax=Panagrolaimus superbus TaxID=310955 RepID=A0A914YE03_9BILA